MVKDIKFETALLRQQNRQLLKQVNSQAKNISDLGDAYEDLRKEKTLLLNENKKLNKIIEFYSKNRTPPKVLEKS